MKNPEIESLFEALKKKMKADGVTYATLAERLDVSESAVKSLFHARSMGLDRLGEILEALGWSFAELSAAAGFEAPGDLYLPEEAEAFFVKNHDHFLFFDLLVLQRKPAGDIQKEHHLDDASVRAYLRQLEKLKLVRELSNGKLEILARGRLRWRVGGPWFKANYHRVLMETANGFIANPGDRDRFLSFGAFSLSRSDLQRFYADLDALLTRYKESAQKELLRPRGRKADELFIGYNVLIAPGPAPGKAARIKRLK